MQHLTGGLIDRRLSWREEHLRGPWTSPKGTELEYMDQGLTKGKYAEVLRIWVRATSAHRVVSYIGGSQKAGSPALLAVFAIAFLGTDYFSLHWLITICLSLLGNSRLFTVGFWESNRGSNFTQTWWWFIIFINPQTISHVILLVSRPSCKNLGFKWTWGRGRVGEGSIGGSPTLLKKKNSGQLLVIKLEKCGCGSNLHLPTQPVFPH